MRARVKPEIAFPAPASASAPAFSRRTLLTFALAVPVIAACDTPDPGLDLPEMTFADLPQINLNIAEVKIVNQHRMTFKAPNIEHIAPVAPGPAAERWVRDVLNPVGNAGSVTVTILNAAITQGSLEKQTGLRGLLTDSQSDEYTATLHVQIAIANANHRAEAKVAVTLSQTVAESTPLNDRSRTWYAMTDKLLDEFDTRMRAEIDKFFTDFKR